MLTWLMGDAMEKMFIKRDLCIFALQTHGRKLIVVRSDLRRHEMLIVKIQQNKAIIDII